MAKSIYLIGGSKGGVGKSLVTMATVDYLQERGESVLLIESDTSNPDVWKAYKESTETELINLDEADGWIQVTIPRQSRGHSGCEPLKAAVRGR